MKGLLFIPEMAVAVMRTSDPKTNTRRVMQPQPVAASVSGTGKMWRLDCPPCAHYFFSDTIAPDVIKRLCDYKVGERRCLLTTWAVHACFDDRKPTQLGSDLRAGDFWHAGTGPKPDWCGKLRPGRFLPNHLRPLMPLFEVAGVGAERVGDITSDGIVAEGVSYPVEKVSETHAKPLLRLTGDFPPANYLARLPGSTLIDTAQINHDTLLRAHWASLWDSINKDRGFGWYDNPWVWVISFRRVTS